MQPYYRYASYAPSYNYHPYRRPVDNSLRRSVLLAALFVVTCGIVHVSLISYAVTLSCIVIAFTQDLEPVEHLLFGVRQITSHYPVRYH